MVSRQFRVLETVGSSPAASTKKSVYLGHSFNLLLISLLGLNIEKLDFAEMLALSFSSLELLISFYEIVGGMGMESISIVVGIGCYGGRPAIEFSEVH